MSFEPLMGWSEPIREKWQLCYVVMTQLDHSTALSPNTPIQAWLGPQQALNTQCIKAEISHNNIPHPSRARPKPRNCERVCLTKDGSPPSALLPLLSRRKWLAKQRFLPATVMVGQLSWHLMLLRVAMTTWQIHWPLPRCFKTCEPETSENHRAWWGIREVKSFN